MRVRFPSPLALSLSLSAVAMLAQAPHARAVVVQGFDASALGGATISGVITPGSPATNLEIGNIGSQGSDGVHLPLHRGDGIRLTFDQPTNPGGTIVRRDIGLYVKEVAGSQVPIIRGTALRTPGGSTRELHCSEVIEYVVEVWSYGSRVRRVQVPISTVVTLIGAHDVTAPEGKVLAYGAKTGKSGSVHPGSRRCIIDESLPTPCDITIAGITVTGDRIVFQVEGDSLGEQCDDSGSDCDDVELRFATGASDPSPASVLIRELALAKDTPVTRPRHAQGPYLARVGDEMLHVDEAEDGAVSYALTGGGPGGGGGGGVIHLSAPDLGATKTHVMHKWFGPTVPEGPISVAMDVECDDGSGLPPQEFTFTATATPMSFECQLTASSAIPGDIVTVQVMSLGRPVGQPSAAGLGSHVQCSTQPIGFTTTGTPLSSSIDVEFPAGTTFETNGQVFTGNMLHMHSVSTHSRRISDVRIVHPPGTPPGTWRLTQGGSSTSPPAGDLGGRDLAARGPRQTVSMDGSYVTLNRRLSFDADADGSLEMMLNGAPSVAFEMMPDPGDPNPELSSLELYDCDAGVCEPSRSLEVARTGGDFHVQGILRDGTSEMVQVGHTILSMPVADPDGDGQLQLSQASAIEPRVILKSYRWLSPHTECFTIEFSEPVHFTAATGVHLTKGLTIWTNPNGGTAGLPTAPPTWVALNGLPPGEPVWWRTAPPAVHSSGNETMRDDVGVLRGGILCRSTWARAHGVDITGEQNGKFTAQHSYMFRLERSALVAGASDPACPGFLVEMGDAAPSLIWSPRSNIFLYGNGRVAGSTSSVMLQGLEVENGGGIPPVLRYVPGETGTDPVVHLYQGGTEVGSAAASEITVSSPPGAVVLNDDDGDGYGDIQARVFPPGTTATLPGQPPIDITRLAFRPAANLQAVTGYDDLVMDLEGLPPGIPVIGTRVSQIMNPSATVDVPPAKPPIAGLEFRGVMPNPARGASTVRLALGRESRIRVQVLDVAGREVARLADGVRTAGEHAFTWSGVSSRGSKAGAGLYFVRVSGDGLPTQTARMIRLD